MPKFKLPKMSFLGYVPLLLLFLLLIFPATSFEYMKNSLDLCISKLVPSLFPFMVISDFLISGNSGNLLKLTLCRLLSFIFGTSSDGSFCVLLGILCGFPIGAKSALKMYEENRISYREFCHIMSFCNIPSPAFLCGTVGVMFGSTALGAVLFCAVIISAAIIGIAGRFIYKYDRRPNVLFSESFDNVSAFTGAVASSAGVMLCVCGYVVFFSVMLGYIRDICTLVNAPDIISILLSGILEISGGMGEISGSGLECSPVIAGFFAGFSGVSVMFQIISLDRGKHIKKAAFVLQKLLHGALCALVVYVALKIFPLSFNSSAPTIEQVTFESYGIYICLLFFVCAILPVLAQVRNK